MSAYSDYKTAKRAYDRLIDNTQCDNFELIEKLDGWHIRYKNSIFGDVQVVQVKSRIVYDMRPTVIDDQTGAIIPNQTRS